MQSLNYGKHLDLDKITIKETKIFDNFIKIPNYIKLERRKGIYRLYPIKPRALMNLYNNCVLIYHIKNLKWQLEKLEKNFHTK